MPYTNSRVASVCDHDVQFFDVTYGAADVASACWLFVLWNPRVHSCVRLCQKQKVKKLFSTNLGLVLRRSFCIKPSVQRQNHQSRWFLIQCLPQTPSARPLNSHQSIQDTVDDSHSMKMRQATKDSVSSKGSFWLWESSSLDQRIQWTLAPAKDLFVCCREISEISTFAGLCYHQYLSNNKWVHLVGSF